jgi:hypothetical protein
MDEAHKNYLRDLGYLIKEAAEEARSSYLAKAAESDAYDLGYLMAYHRIVTLMQQQAEAFGIPLADVSLDNIPEEFFFVQKGSNNSLQGRRP